MNRKRTRSHVISMADRQPEVVRAEGQNEVVDNKLEVRLNQLNECLLMTDLMRYFVA